MTARSIHQRRAQRAGAAAAATLAFTPAAAEGERTPALTGGETWWYSQSLNSVIAFRPCAERTFCTRVVWHEWHDRRLADTFMPPARAGGRAANVCNYQLQAQFNRVNANRWDGRLHIPARNLNTNLRLEARNDSEIRLTARYGVIWRSENLRRVPVGDARYLNCRQVP